jgi:long-subunit fatty acid transport protein
MKNMRILTVLFITAITAVITTTDAQTDQELFLFSQNNLTGNARFTAMGGAFGALGANFGVASTNPAGLGFYTRHEASMSIGVGIWNSETKGILNSEKNNENKRRSTFDVSFQLPDAHYVFSTSDARFQFGIGVNRLNDFNARTNIEGGSKNSFTNAIAENANGIAPDILGGPEKVGLEILAYDGLLINLDNTANNTYFSTLRKAEINQRQITETSGNLTEIVVSFSGNIDKKLYLGATVGIPMLNFSEESTLKEMAVGDAFVELDTNGPFRLSDFTYAHKYDVDGTGINLKLGVVYKPINAIRIGLAFHTPTIFSISQKYERELQVNLPGSSYPYTGWNMSDRFYNRQDIDFKYKFFTPAKAIFSLGFIIGTYGVVGIEGELLSYRNMRMVANNDIADKINDEIKAKYQKVSGVVKIGTEWRVSIVSLRAGYNYRSNPYVMKTENSWSSHLVTGGIGVRFNKSLSLDLGMMYVFNPETYYPYYLDNVNTSVLPDEINTNKMLYNLTFNVRF